MITVRPFCSPLKYKSIKTELANCKKKKITPKWLKLKSFQPLVNIQDNASQQSNAFLKWQNTVLSTFYFPCLKQPPCCSVCSLLLISEVPAPTPCTLWPPQLPFVHISATALVPFFILLYLSAPQQIWGLLKDRSGMLFNPSPSTPYHTGGLADCKCTLKNLTKSNQLTNTLLWLWDFYIIWETNT